MFPILKTTSVRFRIEPGLKDHASNVLATRGLNLSNAIRLFLYQVVVQERLPFTVKTPNVTTIAAMKEARSMKLSKFGSESKLFDNPAKAIVAKTRKSTKKRRQKLLRAQALVRKYIKTGKSLSAELIKERGKY